MEDTSRHRQDFAVVAPGAPALRLHRRSLRDQYNAFYDGEIWTPLELHPDGVSTTRYDDVGRLLRGESGHLLEIGCGSGRLMVALAGQFSRLSGIDISDRRIELAQKVVAEQYRQYSDRLDFQARSADEPLPFADQSFEVVIACAVLEHCIDVFFVVDEIARVLKPDGCAVLTVPNICYVKHVFDMLRGHVPLTGSPNRETAYWREHGWDGQHFHYFSKAALRTLLNNCGLAPEVWTGDGKFAKWRRWYANFVGNLTVRARRR